MNYPQNVIHFLESSLPEVAELSVNSALADNHRLASVLVLIYPAQNDFHILLTKRSNKLTNHAGQISFPGGSIEGGDENMIHTALRETHEEIGLQPDKIRVLGGLKPLVVPSGFAISPVVGTLTPALKALPQLTANPDEVDEIFTIPLSFLLQKSLFQQGSRVKNNIRREFYYFDFKDKYIWGATAAMLLQFSQILAPLNDVKALKHTQD